MFFVLFLYIGAWKLWLATPMACLTDVLLTPMRSFCGFWSLRRLRECSRQVLESLGAVELVGRRLMVVGGHGGRGQGPHAPEAMAEVYDLSGWSVVAGPSKARYLHATCASCGKVLVVGGKDGTEATLSSVEAYDVDTSCWQ